MSFLTHGADFQGCNFTLWPENLEAAEAALKRTEARKEFDKKFSKIKTSNVDLLILDAMIDQEMGKIYFEEFFLKDLEEYLKRFMLKRNLLLF